MFKRKKGSRLLALLMALIMTLGLISVQVFAEDDTCGGDLTPPEPCIVIQTDTDGDSEPGVSDGLDSLDKGLDLDNTVNAGGADSSAESGNSDNDAVVDRSGLLSEIERAELLMQSDIDPEMQMFLEDVQFALDMAIAVLNDPNATQEDVDEAKELLSLTIDYVLGEIEGEEVAVETMSVPAYKAALDRALVRLVSRVPNPGLGGTSASSGEWTILSLARAGYAVPDGYFEGYLERIGTMLDRFSQQENPNSTVNDHWVLNPANGRREVRMRLATDNARLAVALSSLGVDASNFTTASGNTYDLIARMGNRTNATANQMWGEQQGVNGPSWNLIAINSLGWDTPYQISDRAWVGGTTAARPINVPQDMINWLLGRELASGGWVLNTGSNADPDITGMAIVALAPYYESQPLVKAAVDRALTRLSNVQTPRGGFITTAMFGSENSQSASWVIVALTTLGIDPTTDARFIKNGNNPVTALLTYQNADGGFRNAWTANGSGASDAMSTDQAAYALAAYDRFVKGENSLFNMSDAFKPDKAALNAAITDAEGLTQSGYTTQSWNAMRLVLSDAKAVNDNKDAAQQQIDAALAKLTASIEALVESGNVDRAALYEEITKAKNLTETGYTAQSWAAMQKALNDAETVSNYTGASQSEVDDARNSLAAAIAALVAASAPADKSALNNEIARAEALTQSDFTMGSWMALQEALNGAISARNNVNASQSLVDNAAETLRNAIANLLPFGVQQTEQGRVSISVTNPNARPGDPSFFLSRTEFDLEQGETAYTLLHRAGLNIRSSGHAVWAGKYVEAINGWGEFDGGPLSGWMYRVNGQFPDFSSSQYILKAGDRVEWIYTYELGQDIGGNSVVGDNREDEDGEDNENNEGNTAVDTDSGSVVGEVESQVTNGTAVAEVGADVVQSLIEQAQEAREREEDISNITIVVTNTEEVSRVEVNLTAGSLKAIVSEDLSLTVQSDVATVAFDLATLSAMLGNSADDLVITISAAVVETESELNDMQMEIVGDNPVIELKLTVGGEYISEFGGEVTVTVPFTPSEDFYSGDYDLLTVYHIDEIASIKEMKGAAYNPVSGTITFITSHFSLFFVSEWLSPFADVSRDDSFFKSVRYVYSNGLMMGTSEDMFGPDADLSRAMLVTTLWRSEGSPVAAGGKEFSDVGSDQWYTDAIAWASANGIVNGHGNGLFKPYDSLTREQKAVVLKSYAKWKDADINNSEYINAYGDADSVSFWAKDAKNWAYGNNLITGRTRSALMPQSYANRAEKAISLHRLIEDVLREEVIDEDAEVIEE
jgi:hypothetical protein